MALVLILATMSCRPRGASAPEPFMETCAAMSSELEEWIVENLVGYEDNVLFMAYGKRAADGLEMVDPAAGASAAERRCLRERYARLWIRLFAAIDAGRDPSYDPDAPYPKPSPHEKMYDDPPEPAPEYEGATGWIGETHPDPAIRKWYADRRKKWAEQHRQQTEQFARYQVNLYAVPIAEVYFTTAFVRSERNAKRIDELARGLSAERRAQLRSWVAPVRRDGAQERAR